MFNSPKIHEHLQSVPRTDKMFIQDLKSRGIPDYEFYQIPRKNWESVLEITKRYVEVTDANLIARLTLALASKQQEKPGVHRFEDIKITESPTPMAGWDFAFVQNYYPQEKETPCISSSHQL